jgi:cytochrome oxidase Cu insertion factor (SCO1/SenC/PrrC family)
LLDERAPIYAGRRTNEVELLRGHILASFEMLELPNEAVPFVLEELETGTNPAAVAAAGRALRGTSTLPPEAPELLVEAIARLRGRDDALPAELLRPDATVAVTAIGDLASTLVRLGSRAQSALPALTALLNFEGKGFSPSVRATLVTAVDGLSAPAPHHASCCCAEGAAGHQPRTSSLGDPPSARGLAGLELEDQDGGRYTFSDAFRGRPTALAFFYTRCMNPDKCSRTVTRLAGLAQLAENARLAVNVAGISYDPRFDHPERLKRYGVDRGMRFSSHCSLLRTVGPFDPLVNLFGLGVGFGPVTVNRHQLELFVLDSSLCITERFERRLWSEESVLDTLRTAP